MRNQGQINQSADLWTDVTGPIIDICRFLLCVSLGFATASVHADPLAYEPPKRIIFGGDGAYPPFEWLEADAPKGFNVDLARVIADLSGTAVEYRLNHWPDTVRALEIGRVDVVPMLVSPERQEEFLFTMPFHYIVHAIYAREGAAPVYAVGDLRQQRVAVEDRSFAEQQLVVEDIGAVAVSTTDTVNALLAVEEGKADYAILAAPIADRLIHARGLSLKRLGPPFWSRAYAFAVRKDRAELRDWLQQALALAISTGAYQDVYDTWRAELKYPGSDDGGITRAVATSLLVLAALVAISLGWSWTLRGRVQSRTSDLRYALEQVQAAESRTRRLANFDTETGLAKPAHFAALVDEMLTEQAGHSSLEAELLILKLVDLNDVVGTFGKTYSEEWTRHFADRLQSLCRGPCAYFGRAVFAVCSDRQRIRELFDSLAAQRDPEATYTHVVGGSAYYPEHGTVSVELIRRAEMALAIGLSTHERWAAYDPSMEPDPHNIEIVSCFRKNHVEGLYSVFQPQIDLKTRTIAAAEALVRWKHPRLGPVSPEKFIPLIEKAGLVPKVTAMMINEAVRVSSHLRRLHRPVTISVNIAVFDLTSTDLRQVVTDALDRHEGHPADLKLELTETSFASDCSQIGAVLDQLSELGVGIAIDDFGTGYSSLSYLSIFPIQELKIDRLFVSDMSSNERNCSIVRSTILMAKQLGLQSVAEGAEDQTTVQMLEDYGCDRVQGYVFSKPLPEAEFIDFVRRNS